MHVSPPKPVSGHVFKIERKRGGSARTEASAARPHLAAIHEVKEE